MIEVIEEHFNVNEACGAQEKYCKEHNVPRFAPYTGFCYRCCSQIYSKNGYSVEYASSRLVTGCPFCGASYVD